MLGTTTDHASPSPTKRAVISSSLFLGKDFTVVMAVFSGSRE